MPVWRLLSRTCQWHARSPLYRAALVMVLGGLPLNVLAALLPYWLEVQDGAVSAPAADGRPIVGDPLLRQAYVFYGLWQMCVGSHGVCYGVFEVQNDVGIGDWLYAVDLLMVVSLGLHILSFACGILQNFVPRQSLRRWSRPFWKNLAHMDCTYLEDVGFAAGFLGQASAIVFLLCTKEQISRGAHYSVSFAISFLATIATVLATLALTKVHTITPPRVRRADPRGIGPGEGGGSSGGAHGGGGGGGGGGSAAAPQDGGSQGLSPRARPTHHSGARARGARPSGSPPPGQESTQGHRPRRKDSASPRTSDGEHPGREVRDSITQPTAQEGAWREGADGVRYYSYDNIDLSHPGSATPPPGTRADDGSRSGGTHPAAPASFSAPATSSRDSSRASSGRRSGGTNLRRSPELENLCAAVDDDAPTTSAASARSLPNPGLGPQGGHVSATDAAVPDLTKVASATSGEAPRRTPPPPLCAASDNLSAQAGSESPVNVVNEVLTPPPDSASPSPEGSASPSGSSGPTTRAKSGAQSPARPASRSTDSRPTAHAPADDHKQATVYRSIVNVKGGNTVKPLRGQEVKSDGTSDSAVSDARQ